jgi:hypothetical protein
VPFFYYVSHLFLIHVLAVLFAAVKHGTVAFLFQTSLTDFPANPPARLRLWASGCLSRLDRGDSDAHASLPLVRQPQSPPPRSLAELSCDKKPGALQPTAI